MTRLEAVLIRHADALDALVRHYVTDDSERDELRQDIAVALWRAMPAFRAEAAERTYVLRVARNRAITFCVRRAQRRALFIDLDDLLPATLAVDALERYGSLRDAVHAHLAMLSPLQRHTLILTTHGWAPGEIASLLGRSAVSVRVALHRARHSLREHLAES